jgi:hypothetical protein
MRPVIATPHAIASNASSTTRIMWCRMAIYFGSGVGGND